MSSLKAAVPPAVPKHACHGDSNAETGSNEVHSVRLLLSCPKRHRTEGEVQQGCLCPYCPLRVILQLPQQTHPTHPEDVSSMLRPCKPSAPPPGETIANGFGRIPCI
jgi:hypothetical protein